MENRRKFIQKMAVASAAMLAGEKTFAFTAKSYRHIIGANDRVHMAIIGLNGRGTSMAGTFARQKNLNIATVCDVDTRVFAKALKAVADAGQADAPKTEGDFRKVLSDKNIDGIYIATPDHWHTPMTILGCQAGKHVYVEKPISHNPHEGELVTAAAKKYKKVVQMGAQRRSAPILTQGIEELHKGVIGRVYYAKTWYTNTRKATFLKPGAVPAELNYELWQGPAPRKPYQEGLIHYNWHWFWHYGTGEALNNGTHEYDVARWGLGVDFPEHITSTGGRYAFKDDWQTPDTQVVTMDFPNRTTIMWESRSCNGRKVEGADRGIIFYGEGGSLDTGGDSYKIYDQEGKLLKEVKSEAAEPAVQGRNTASVSASMDSLHVADFIDAMRNNRKPNCDAETGHITCLSMHLSNIAWRLKRDLKVDPKTGHILNDPEAQKMWSRTYEPGWEPKV
ncbi:Gfo/Idh/MocA family oxidoreductase [Mucilaginibacter sp. RS28]|uniref:Gfo/Idh/MocA family oxidoreductase n=1 Tax=Mucilaginibacter straminoryzae TaxID=2932774 RepID=A0A9X2BEW6_9SPHI|nr:Gfo/Idh/MocA family oxidoreductase [Mucilaginibacter straminoryzae]MCJ8211863.1 Gfo/Idh/MocA family oxidoreductase [Mucilaginibacter straminoryzae]